MKTSHWVVAACLAASLPTLAHAGFKPIEIKDSELSELRGRYVMPGRIISFGVVMSSTWRNASGDMIGASTSMQIQASTVKPQFYVSTVNEPGSGNKGHSQSQGTGNIYGGAALSSTQGVTQSVRAAGDGNTAYNNVAIDVKEASSAPAPLAPPPGSQVLTAGNTINASNAAGSIAISANSGGIQMAIAANNNQGSTLQQVAQGGLLQNTRLLGDSNMVNNLTQLNVVLNNNGPSPGALDCNLSQLKGLRNMGY
ncbi:MULTISPECIES: hypothetical protein [Pseudomonas]|jgi:hypothetical protein|uniref:hypothetical protein n=1 Tax=Pseudomonas TaxID=286 RepID=UPI000488CE11|nr:MULTISPECIES: hypothetical protein [Pseudomonas]PRA56893.1 hypothetical protein CQZ98_08545 [Pseudomonas sp. MYb115]QXN47638.1 hypothetical protein KW062_15070 [Pseudomonas fluorescens]WSO21940.1 hypothetical protein VUJ50_15160 [Pseudomonas fluorescens]